MSRESLSAAICILFGPREISIEATGNIPLLAVCLGPYSGQNNYDTTTATQCCGQNNYDITMTMQYSGQNNYDTTTAIQYSRSEQYNTTFRTVMTLRPELNSEQNYDKTMTMPCSEEKMSERQTKAGNLEVF